MGHQARIVIALLVVALNAGCSTADLRPSEFDDMTADEIGCTILYGSGSKYLVGPIGPSDFRVIEPNDYTKFRIGRTALDITIWARSFGGSGMDGSIPLDGIPDDGIETRSEFMDAGNTGYKITCWRGEG